MPPTDPVAITLQLHPDAAIRAWAAAAQATGAHAPRHVARALLAKTTHTNDDWFAAGLEGMRAAGVEDQAAIAAGAPRVAPRVTIELQLDGDHAALVCCDDSGDWKLRLALAAAPSQDWVIDLQGSQAHPRRAHALVMMAALWHDSGDEWNQICAAARAAGVTLAHDVQSADVEIQWEATPVERYRHNSHTYHWQVGADCHRCWWVRDRNESALLESIACHGPYLTRLDAVMTAEIATDKFCLVQFATRLPVESPRSP